MIRVTRIGDVTRLDIARTILGRGRYWTVAYLVDGLLIDTGCAHTAGELVEALAGERMDRVVNTHSHEDHIGGNAAMKRARPGLEVLAHPEALPVLADPARRQPLHPYRHVFWGMPEPSRGRAVADGEVIEAGGGRFRVVFTPGHAPDHVCLFEENRGYLFSGDLYVGGRDRALRVDYDIHAIVASLKRVADLPTRTLFPGAARVPEDGPGALREKIEHLEATGARIAELHRAGRTDREIAAEVCGPWMPMELLTGGNFSRVALVRSFLRGEGQRSEV
jgi:glyoxylase-like metal-dependent hydrolase (beta-lactamase superfamily II)